MGLQVIDPKWTSSATAQALLPELSAALNHNNEHVRLSAVQALADSLNDKGESGRIAEAALKALSAIGEEAIPALLPVLEHRRTTKRERQSRRMTTGYSRKDRATDRIRTCNLRLRRPRSRCSRKPQIDRIPLQFHHSKRRSRRFHNFQILHCFRWHSKSSVTD